MIVFAFIYITHPLDGNNLGGLAWPIDVITLRLTTVSEEKVDKMDLKRTAFLIIMANADFETILQGTCLQKCSANGKSKYSLYTVQTDPFFQKYVYKQNKTKLRLFFDAFI